MEKTEMVRDKGQDARPLDTFDRKILGELARDAGLSYADLGSRVGLSAPAVHERVKRLRTTGRIRGTVAMLDGPATGKPFLAFVHVDSTGWGKTQELLALSELPEVEEIHSVAGDTCMLLKVRCASSRALEGLLARLYALPSVKATRSYVVLSTFLERTPQAGITEVLEEPPMNEVPR
ncbi:Lrp/AsnC family transcriptional regulator [Billgrantia antri]|uniref:Lrp/AsnC family transcriptional regulator n=2 Tax=Halomonadaceae TaxID=28256 RepID=A0ABX7WC12_9GAMM|nr:Lrp/AsnC family transcriptional regulator [Halomonas sulfidivorans]